jgi:hypothetical protein
MKKKRTQLLLLTLLGCGWSSYMQAQMSDANRHPIQTIQNSQPGEGRIVIRQDAGIEQMMVDNLEENRHIVFFEGYRIQLYSGSGVNSRKEAMAVKIKFLGLFPDEKVDLYYNAPFWRVRVGSYRFKNESLPLLTKVKIHFPSSYVVKDNQVKKNDIE